MTISVLVVEGSRLLRDEITEILNREPDLHVVATAESCEAALLGARETKPQVVLLDAMVPASQSHNRSTCLEDLKQAAPDAKVIVMDLAQANGKIVEFVKAGASGFIVKDATVADIVTAVRSVAAGKDVLPSVLAGVLFSDIANGALGHAPLPAIRAVSMTLRERQVVDLIAKGMSNKEIAHQLNLSSYTIKSYVHRVLEKLALNSRLELAAVAHQAELQGKTR